MTNKTVPISEEHALTAHKLREAEYVLTQIMCIVTEGDRHRYKRRKRPPHTALPDG